MDPQLYADLVRSPLFTPEKIDEVLTYFHRRPDLFELEPDLPLTPINAYEIEMDYAVARSGGMTPMVAPGTESPIHDRAYSRGRGTFKAASFREKVVLTEKDLANIRKLGSLSDLKNAQEIMMEKTSDIQKRLATRLEWMRRQLIFDSEVTATMADGTEFSVSYDRPTFMDVTLTGTDLWSDYANSDPLVNLQEWVEDFIEDSGMSVRAVRMPKFSMKHLQQNDRFRGALLYNRPAANVGLSQISEEIALHVGLASATQLEVSRGQLSIDTQLTAASAAADTTIDVGNTQGVVAGDTLLIAATNTGGQYQEKFTVVSVSANEVTVTPGVARATGFAIGDAVRIKKHTQPLDRLLILGSNPEAVDTSGIESGVQPPSPKWAVLASTLSHHANLYSPTSGVYTRSIPYLDGDPPRVEQLIGVDALPKVNNSLGWFTAKIL